MSPRSATKRPFRISTVLARIRREVASYANAAMFELHERGHTTLFEQLVACIISIRTYDEVSLPAALRLFARARTPEAIAALGAPAVDRLIGDATFHENKARQIVAIARRTAEEFGGELPCDAELLMSFAGVGPKCANLALGVACGEARISVDIHVHRVTNRWGYVSAPTPEATMLALEKVLPKKYWIEINRLLVPFGKHVCTGTRPKCSTCPVLEYCRQVGVVDPR
ncbi:MAG TPA: endonuclease III [Gemmatimonadaceae bacterium]|nr:endonuclease III [Gemmatimonadaceae bacterium]